MEFTIGSTDPQFGTKGGDYSLSAWQALGGFGYDANSLVADPQFVSPGTGDLHLQAGSPCAGMGANAGANPMPG